MDSGAGASPKAGSQREDVCRSAKRPGSIDADIDHLRSSRTIREILRVIIPLDRRSASTAESSRALEKGSSRLIAAFAPGCSASDLCPQPRSALARIAFDEKVSPWRSSSRHGSALPGGGTKAIRARDEFGSAVPRRFLALAPRRPPLPKEAALTEPHSLIAINPAFGRMGEENAFAVLARAAELAAPGARHHQSRHRPARFQNSGPYRRGRRQGAARRRARLYRRDRDPAVREAVAEDIDRRLRSKSRPTTC